jgi:outer membrane protein
MKNPVRQILTLAALAASVVVAQAQAPKVAIVDMAKLYDAHYKTEEQNAKLKADEQTAQAELDKLNTEGNALVAEFKELNEKANNPALTNEAKQTAAASAQQKAQQIQAKQQEVQSFTQNTQRSLQQRINTFRQILLEEISKTATEVAKKKGNTLLLDKSGPSFIGVPSVIYFDGSYDITPDVMTEINKDRPAAAVAVPAAAAKPAVAAPAPAAAKTPEQMKIAVPGAKK